MGISLKDIFKNDEERLIENKRKTAMKNMIILSCVIVVFIILALIVKFWGNVDEERRIAITRDIQNIQTAVLAYAELQMSNENTEDFPGQSLDENGVTLNVNGVVEEYRYGYYLLEPEDLTELNVSLNLPNETYVVNYETGDVVNGGGIKYNKRVYHSIDDLLAIDKGYVPISDQVVIISNANDLNKIRQIPNGYFKLSANIDLSEFSNLKEGWEPIPTFSGVLDGRGYTISNLTINRATQTYVGLFGDVKSSAKITNLTLENVDIVGNQYTGSLAGNCAGAVSYVHVKGGNVTGYSSSTGGLLGAFGTEKINNCTVSVSVDGDSAVGGAIGTLYSGTVERVSAKGSVTASQNVGGLIGHARISNATYIQESVAYTEVNGKTNLGGLIGGIEMTASRNLDISNSYVVGSVQTGENNIGGMFGQVYTVQGTPNITLKNLYADVSVVMKGETSGGFIGECAVGGSTGQIVENCFWKKDLAPGEELNGVGRASQGSIMTFVDKVPAQMLMMREYTTWNFESIWDIEERVSSPTLKWEKNYAQEEKDDKK